MYMKQPTDEGGVASMPLPARAALVIASAATLYLGLAPRAVLELARETVASLM